MHRSTHAPRAHFGCRMSHRGWSHAGPHRRAHRARRGDVRGAILALLAEEPMHGYEMIQRLEERTGGRWRPSAGSIYPTLQLLEDEGLVSAEEVDGRRVFKLTDEGRQAAEKRGGEKPPWQGDDSQSPIGDLRSVAFQVAAAVRQVGQAGTEEQLTRAVGVLTETRKKLYSILAED
jgi:DNA-binding PadR family transcriptional regulator